jgi:hypothetical protein
MVPRDEIACTTSLAATLPRSAHCSHDEQDKLQLLLVLAKVLIALTRQCQTLLVLKDS